MAGTRILTTRRTTLSVALSLPLALGACDLDPPSSAPSPPSTPEPAPDAGVVAAARQTILLMVASIEAATLAHPRLRPGLAPFLALHAAHLDVLDDGSTDDEVDGRAPAGRAAVTRQRLLSEETALSTRLADASRLAQSGDLARVLASMSAAVRQVLVS